MGIVAKYKFDHNVYADLVPVFNAEFTTYNVTDEVAEDGSYTIRTIESDSLPTFMRFATGDSNSVSARELCLLEVIEVDFSNCTSLYHYFRRCSNLTNVYITGFNDGLNGMDNMFGYCSSLKYLDFRNCNAELSALQFAFIGCSSLTTLDISNLKLSSSVNTMDMLTGVAYIKYIKCNIPNTISIISPLLPTRTSDNQGTIIYQGAETLSSEVITELQAKGWNVVTSPQLIAKYKYDSKIYKNLIPSFNDGYMGFVEDEEVDENGVVTRKIEHVELPTRIRFGDASGSDITDKCLSLLEVLDMNTNGLTTAYAMFMRNTNLTKINCNWNTSKITDFGRMFYNCPNLREVELEKFDVSNGTHINFMFYYCYNLPNTLDLSGWDISNVINANNLFNNCASIQRLDISNFSINSSANFNDAFVNVKNLTDIGMIYCDQSTINKVASLLPTNHNITIWVESDDITQYDQYDHITYKTQKVQDTVHLNSPLLKGDTIEVIDGKTYHVHRYEKFVFDGSLNVYDLNNCVDGVNKYYNFVIPINQTIYPKPTGNNQISDKLLSGNPYTTKNTFWILAQNTNMEFRLNIENLKTVDEYKQYLQENPITVIYELATPYYELISEEPLELTLLDTTDNTINNNSILPSNMSIANKELSTIAIKPSTTYTLAFDKSIEDSEVTIDICGGEQVTTVGNMVQLTTPSELGSGIRFISSDGCIVSNVRLIEGGLVEKAIPKESFEGLQSSFDDGRVMYHVDNLIKDIPIQLNSNGTASQIPFKGKDVSYGTTQCTVFLEGDTNYGEYALCYRQIGQSGTWKGNLVIAQGKHVYNAPSGMEFYAIQSNGVKNDGSIVNFNAVVLEGDRLTDEDFNNLGKYKVEYKVTGKNKFDKNLYQNLHTNYEYTEAEYMCKSIQLKPNTKYTVSAKASDNSGLVLIGDKRAVNGTSYLDLRKTTEISKIYTTSSDGKLYIGKYGIANDLCNLIMDRIQIEEGAVATEYESYKEDIKTYYLSSPFLEGDTIEDVNGVATHVKRYEKVVLDGSENWRNFEYTDDTIVSFKYAIDNTTGISMYRYIISDRFKTLVSHETIFENWSEGIALHGWAYGNVICISKSKLSTLDVNGFKQWLSENPTTVVYELVSPIYEPISTESILCDSYVNGHLDVDTDIPIEKVEFRYYLNNLVYLQPNTKYVVKFESDNVGKIDKLNLGGFGIFNLDVVKGINTFEVTTPAELIYGKALAITGVGFNASNIQVVANALDDNGEVKEFDYFKGLKSSFEDGLITDENDENYGKYKVECKIVGKNKFDINSLTSTSDNFIVSGDKISINTSSQYCIMIGKKLDLIPGNQYVLQGYTTPGSEISIRNLDGISIAYLGDRVDSNNYQSCKFIATEGCYFRCSNRTLVSTNVNFSNIQIEEGTQATSYEPYKESIHTLYLNSPLLKGDKIVVHNGKLCHCHKMGMVVLDGSATILYRSIGDSVISFRFKLPDDARCTSNSNGIDAGYTFISDRLPLVDSATKCGIYGATALHTYNGELLKVGYISLLHEYITNDISNITWSAAQTNAKKWLQANPTTVVYELAEPYYEPIEPQVSQYSLPSVKDGDMEILTALPIKIDLTYRTDINGTTTLEEELANAQSSTDLTDIINSEVDE